MSLRKGYVARPGSLAARLAGLFAFGCCLTASLALPVASQAVVPTAGLNCQVDGKISGRGASYQAHAEAAFSQAYSEDFCGNVAEQYSGDPAGKTMVTYNYPAAEAVKSGTGASAGLKAASCRTDAYAGDSLPYTEAQLGELNAAPGTAKGCTLEFTPPYEPQASKNEFPNSTDTTAPVMSFPVAGTSTAIAVNFSGVCTTKPTSLKLDAKEVSRIFGGDAATWEDSELVENNPALSTDGCTGKITRVVRQDSSGTTEIFKAYLVRAENERSGASFTCAVGKKWSEYTKTNTEWPGKQSEGKEGTCSTITTATKSGGPEEMSKIKATNGGVGYADLPDEAAAVSGLVTAVVQNATLSSFVSPSSGGGANCLYAGVVDLPGNGTKSEDVGIGNTEGKNWATNAEPNEQNVTDIGAKYPICGLTFDLVYSGLDNNLGTNNAITPLNADQRRTLYSYFTFVLSSTAQNLLSTIDYAPLPAAWLQSLREGFQENF